jgi:hypothetical protein
MLKQFRVVAKSPAGFLIPNDQTLTIKHLIGGLPIQLNFRTRYLQRGFSALVPGDLCLDAIGEAENLDLSIKRFTNAGRAMGEILSFASNAAVTELEPEVAFELNPSEGKRHFFQRLLPADEFAYTSRFIDVEATKSLLGAIATHCERDRLLRAISHYSEALRTWGMGNELRTLCQLFIGIESIKTASWRTELTQQNISKNELAKKWGFDEAKRQNLDEFINSHARSLLVFKGDADLLKTAKDVSDSFEHGYKNFPDLYEPAGRALVKTANCLRAEIIRVSGVNAQVISKLLGEKFAQPRGKSGLVTYIYGVLSGDIVDPAKSGSAYPHLNWESKLNDVSFDESTQKYSFRPNTNFTANIGADASLTEIKFETWDGSVFMPGDDWHGAS